MNDTVTTPLWRDSKLKRLVAALAYPIVLILNRPCFYGFAKIAYDFSLRCNGIAINFPGSHGITKAEERFLSRVADKLRDGVLIDVGANAGAYSRFLSAISPASPIYAFEPHPKTFDVLKGRVDATRVTPINRALSSKAGSVTLYDFADNDGSTQASLSEQAVTLYSGGVTKHNVVSTTIDDFMAQNGIERVRLLKVDTEGYDLDVLRGAKQALAGKRVDFVQFEFIPANIATGATMRGFFDALDGYEIYRLCLNGDLLPLRSYDVKRCEIYVTQILIAKPSS